MTIKIEWEKDPTNGRYFGPDGCSYETLWESRSSGVLGMCGCGNPKEAYNFLRKAIALFDRRGYHDNPPTKEWISAEDALAKLITSDPETAAHAMLHLLDNTGVMEYGGSIGGSWLTPSGEDIVDGDPALDEDEIPNTKEPIPRDEAPEK